MSKLRKATVDVSTGVVRPSRIRRDPPPPAGKPPVLADVAEREARTVVLGVVLFAVAISVIIIAFSDYLAS